MENLITGVVSVSDNLRCKLTEITHLFFFQRIMFYLFVFHLTFFPFTHSHTATTPSPSWYLTLSRTNINTKTVTSRTARDACPNPRRFPSKFRSQELLCPQKCTEQESNIIFNSQHRRWRAFQTRLTSSRVKMLNLPRGRSYSPTATACKKEKKWGERGTVRLPGGLPSPRLTQGKDVRENIVCTYTIYYTTLCKHMSTIS